MGVVEYDEADWEEILERKYRTVWRRIGAALIDVILFIVSYFIAGWFAIYYVTSSYRGERGFPFPDSRIFLVLYGLPLCWQAGGLLYRIGMHKWRGQTLGKRALGVRVVTVQGESLSYRHAILRDLLGICALIYSVITILPYFGLSLQEQFFLMAMRGSSTGLEYMAPTGFFIVGIVNLLLLLIHPQHRTVDDFIAGTVVCRADALEVEEQLARKAATESSSI